MFIRRAGARGTRSAFAVSRPIGELGQKFTGVSGRGWTRK